LAASVAFRRYLAQRDVFVRRNAHAVFQLRREIANLVSRGLPPTDGENVGRKARPTRTVRNLLEKLRHEAAIFAAALRAGRAAARAMWNRSRDPHEQGPNELMLEHDAERLREWRLWLKRAGRNLNIIWRATRVCGVWQLQFTVHNFAPALQKVVVEQRQPDGTWVTLHGLPLVEFRAFAARPQTRIRREFSVPVAAPRCRAGSPNPAAISDGGGRAPSFPPLRLAVRGVGQIAVSRVELTDGVVRCHPSGWPPARKKLLGRPAPRRGFPVVGWTKNQDSKRLTFRPSRNSSQGTQSTSSRFRRSLPR
jgi:hypothetical protein